MIMAEPIRPKATKPTDEPAPAPKRSGPSGASGAGLPPVKSGVSPSVPSSGKNVREPDAPAASGTPAPLGSDETLLIKRARQGDLEAYDELVRRYQERIYA